MMERFWQFLIFIPKEHRCRAGSDIIILMLPGKEKADNKVTADTYEDMLIGEIFFMGMTDLLQLEIMDLRFIQEKILQSR